MQVNLKLVAVMGRLVEGLTELHVDLPDSVPSYASDGTEGQRLGLSLIIPAVEPTAKLQALVERWNFDGYPLEDGTVELRFLGTPEEASDLNDQALAARIDNLDSADVSGPNPAHWPGSRELVLGDNGQDVRFLRLLFGVGDDIDPMGDDVFVVLHGFQRRRGAPDVEMIDLANPRVDATLWRRILPKGRPYVAQGDAGYNVRVLQAALAAYEGTDTKVTGIWGVLTNRDVAQLQKTYSLRPAQFVRAPEWALLLGPEVTAASTAAL
jgi:hypothetical protein